MPTDSELIEAYEEGREEAFAKLLERYFTAVHNFLFRLTGSAEDAADVSQETFLKAWKNLSRFKKGANFKTWLFAIARNSAIDHLRKKHPLLFSSFQKEETDEMETLLPDHSPTQEERFDAALQKDAVERGLQKLSPVYREILVLHYQEALTLEEAAQVLGIPLNTAKSRDRRALLALRDLMGPKKP